MTRTVSSAQTFLMKVIFPAIWISGFGVAAVGALTGRLPQAGGGTLPGELAWFFPVMWVVGSAFIYWGCIRLKRVRLDGDSILISNYRREIRVPLRDIEAVTEHPWINLHPVTLHFRRATDFGTSVVFMPTIRWFAFMAPHPIVPELRTLAQQHSSRTIGVPAA